jgi:hydroxylamine reductase
MFCYQCEQTAKGSGCTSWGVCGKSPETAALQDLLIYGLKGLSMYAHRARQLGAKDHDLDVFTLKVLFSTVTNVSFDPEKLYKMVLELAEKRDRAKKLYESAAQNSGQTPEVLDGPVLWNPTDTFEGVIQQGEAVTLVNRLENPGADITGLKELLLYGLKGMAAYADHAQILGKENESVYGFFHEALDFLTRTDVTADDLVGMCMRCGEMNLTVMALLDAANTDTYGHPEPTEVRVDPVRGKAILVLGHDLKDLEALLKQTEGKGINIYTHGEMLPANAYPGLKKYKHLVGNYGTAWQNQQKEFEAFPGAILMTTNCIQKPKDSYINRIFTSGLVTWSSVTHITDMDFSPVIESAQKAEGFREDGPGKKIMIGFARQTVLGVAPQVIEAVKSGAIRHFFLVGGCDGVKQDRNYFTEFAEKVPDDAVILTLACGKYRFNMLDFGDIGGIPRLLDVGQCNDAYSAIMIAAALADAFGVSVNELPLSLVLSWYEQKAVVILLSLLHLGIRNIRLGPSLPAFITPPVLQVLVDKFNIMPTTTPENDLKAILGEAALSK